MTSRYTGKRGMLRHIHLDTKKELIGDVTTISEITPHRVSVTTTTRISGKSAIRSTISLSSALEHSETLLETTAEIDWHESMKFLKVEFPVNIRNTEATYETQYGISKRPTHYKTSWDRAKFEVCCQKFADLSEYGYGVSILNNEKYGFATVGYVMRLSLRSSKAPDDTADMGKHTIRWTIMPHSGQLGARTVRAAFDFNKPLKLVRAVSEKRSILHDYPISLQGDDSLVLDTIKRGEDNEDISLGELAARKGRSVILRIYDPLGGRSRGITAVNWRSANFIEQIFWRMT